MLSTWRTIGQRGISSLASLKTLVVEDVGKGVVHVQLNRPDQRNALTRELWGELKHTFEYLAITPSARVIVLSGRGASFCSGIDLRAGITEITGISADPNLDVSRKFFRLRHLIGSAQASQVAIEKCSKPVIAAIHGHCVGGATSLAACCDIRYAQSTSVFSIKEVDVGLAADIGVLERLGRITGNESWAREVAFSGRNFQAAEALQFGYVSRIFDSQSDCLAAALDLAALIAQKSPVAVQGTKMALNYARNHGVDDTTEFLRNWNSANLQTEDLLKIAESIMTKKKPEFNDL